MSWAIQIGLERGPISAPDGRTVENCVLAGLMVDGLDYKMAEQLGKEAWQKVSSSREVWSTILKDGRSLTVWDSSPAPQYDKQCDGLDGNGDRCGKYMNHPREC